MKGSTLVYLLVICLTAAPVLATEISPGPVSGDWYATGNPYNVNGEINIPTDLTLNIHPGVEVIFQGHYKFIVYGYLEALGVEGDSILFTAADTSTGWHSIRFIDAQDSSHLSYCIIQYGQALGDVPNDMGGGVFCSGSNPDISHSSFRWNYADMYGGGISMAYDSNPTISYCTFSENTALVNGGIGGGWIAAPIITHCTISGNTATIMNGGIGMGEVANPTITYCTISGNTTITGGSGGIGFGYDCSGIVDNCIITENSAAGNFGGIGIAFVADPIISNCTITGNSAGGTGGGIGIGHVADPTISNCTITGNTAGNHGGGIACIDSVNPTILNTIVAGNSGSGGIYFEDAGNTFVTYCDFYDNEGGDFTGTSIPSGLGVITSTNYNSDPCDMFMNIFMDPCFVDPAGGDYHLLADSPCIDAGDPASPLDPDGTVADIGAFYFDQLGVEDQTESVVPTTFRLFQNYPNPFNPTTMLRYSLPQPGVVTLTIHNILGQRVATLFEGRQRSGYHTITWDASDVSSGIYFARLKNVDQVKSLKMVLTK